MTIRIEHIDLFLNLFHVGDKDHLVNQMACVDFLKDHADERQLQKVINLLSLSQSCPRMIQILDIFAKFGDKVLRKRAAKISRAFNRFKHIPKRKKRMFQLPSNNQVREWLLNGIPKNCFLFNKKRNLSYKIIRREKKTA